MEKLQNRGTTFNESEMQNIQNVRNLLSEVGTEIDAQTSLAAELTRFWAGFYDDTWVWGGKNATLFCLSLMVISSEFVRSVFGQAYHLPILVPFDPQVVSIEIAGANMSYSDTENGLGAQRACNSIRSGPGSPDTLNSAASENSKHSLCSFCMGFV